jgi:hypothetical protein
MTSISDLAKSDCNECDGEGIVFYQTSVDDGYDTECPKCFPDGLEPDGDDD